MSDFRTFERATMQALYQSWKDGAPLVSLAKVLEQAGVGWENGWLVRVHDSLRNKGFLEGPLNRRIEGMTIGALTASGLQYVEDSLLSSNSVAELTASDVIEGSVWTGLPQDFVLSDRGRAEIVNELDRTESSLVDMGVSQHDQSQARAYIVAARALLEAPEPEPELAWTILNRANQLAGIASLFISIIALFQATH